MFITALLMARPKNFERPLEQLHVKTGKPTGFLVPPGCYGFVEAAGLAIVNRALLDHETGLADLEKLGEPEGESRSSEHGGRRMVRVEGGYVVLNYILYREKDGSSVVVEGSGYTYYLGTRNALDAVKIGYSKNPWSRLSALRPSHPSLEVLAVERGDAQHGLDRQAQFANDRIDGEWFRRSDSLASLIAELQSKSDLQKEQYSSRRRRNYGSASGNYPSSSGSSSGSERLGIEAEVEVEVKNTTTTRLPTPEEAENATMFASAVIDEADLSGMKLRVVLEEIGRREFKRGAKLDALKDEAVLAWKNFVAERRKGVLEIEWGAEKFYGEGHWRDPPASWPRKKRGAGVGDPMDRLKFVNR